MRKALAALMCMLAPTLAKAQPDVAPLPRNDAAASIGWFGAEHDEVGRYDRWHGSLYAGLGLGHYWTDNLKTEVEAAWIGEALAHVYEEIIVGPDRTYAESVYRFRDAKVSLAQAFQFGRNAWVHPFVAGGVDVDRLQTTEDRPPQDRLISRSGRVTQTVLIPGVRESETRWQARPFVKTGLKMYVSDRGFFTTELKFGVGRGVEHVLWKTGIGVDF
ncbi:MAG: hypothetical protein EXQ55_04675 [Acidobacteria bacterium]|nr:hypothetical protein [Acidobacteriota bacterium]